jgi:hypothetical protein
VAGRATLRVTLIDSVASTPLAGTLVRLAWSEYGAPRRGLRPVEPHELNAVTDGEGGVVFCALPPDVSIALGFPLAEGQVRRLAVFRLRADAILLEEVRTTRLR